VQGITEGEMKENFWWVGPPPTSIKVRNPKIAQKQHGDQRIYTSITIFPVLKKIKVESHFFGLFFHANHTVIP